MTPETFQLFFSLLTLVAMGIAVTALVPWVVRGWREPVWGALEALRLPLATAIAGTAMLGSLYFSEVANYQPCTLCWYQRILMYPSAVVLAIATARRDVAVRWYVLPLTVIGVGVSTYHYLLERFPRSLHTGVCDVGVPCSFIWFTRFGFITIPFMALCGFAAVIALLLIPDWSAATAADDVEEAV